MRSLRRNSMSKPATEADLALDALEGKDDFGLSELQRASLHKRLTAMETPEKTHSISFSAIGSATWPTECCSKPMIGINGHKEPHENFERCLAPACVRKICTLCGEMK